MVGGYLLLGASSWVIGTQIGILGVALATLIATGTIALLTFQRLRQRFGLILPARSAWLMLYGMTALLLTGVAFRELDPWSPLLILVRVAVFGAFVSSLLLFLRADERRALFAAIRGGLRDGGGDWRVGALRRGYGRIAAIALRRAGVER
jgi:hypothetical protein